MADGPDHGLVLETDRLLLRPWRVHEAAVQREIDSLQEAGAARHESEIAALWERKKTLLKLIADS